MNPTANGREFHLDYRAGRMILREPTADCSSWIFVILIVILILISIPVDR